MPLKQIDKNLIISAQKGDINAFEKVLSMYEKSVFNFTLRHVKNREDAEDITQEIFLKLYRHLKKYNFKNKFSTWLFAIAKNAIYDFFRKKKRRKEQFVFDSQDSKMVSFLNSIANSRFDAAKNIKIDIDRALAKLKPVYKKTITLFYWEGFAYADIAEKLKIPVNTVKTYIYRAKKELAGELI